MIACGDNSSSEEAREPSIPIFVEQEMQYIKVRWENPAFPAAALSNITIKLFLAEEEETQEVFSRGEILNTGEQERRIPVSAKGGRYRVVFSFVYVKTVAVCEELCNICYDLRVPTEEVYEEITEERDIFITPVAESEAGMSVRAEPLSDESETDKMIVQAAAPNGDDGEDADGDGVGNALDPDDDGDGLIEIRTPQEFNNIRYVLDGSGYGTGKGQSLQREGCQAHLHSPPIKACYGYELMANISLAAYPNWTPFGTDRDILDFPLPATAFTAHFDGNNHTIADLSIDRPASSCVGLFGNARNATFRNVRLSFDQVIGRGRVGSFIGNAEGLNLSSVFVTGRDVRGEFSAVGGLAGAAPNAVIKFAHARLNSLKGAGALGGLIGSADNSTVRSSSAQLTDLVGTNPNRDGEALVESLAGGVINGTGFSVGGLLGRARFSRIENSSARSNAVYGIGFLGGLIGDAYNASVEDGTAHSKSLSAVLTSVGGLIGYGYGARVLSSAAYGSVEAPAASRVGGLIGDGRAAFVSHSAAYNGSVQGYVDVGGLIGSAQNSFINASFARKERITAREDAGGLLGDAADAVVFFSHTEGKIIRAAREAGGFIGDASRAHIYSSNASWEDIRIDDSWDRGSAVDGVGAGGFIADAQGTRIAAVRVQGTRVRAGSSVLALGSAGGLVGRGHNISITDAVVRIADISGYRAGGLIGDGRNAVVNSSFYNVTRSRIWNPPSRNYAFGVAAGLIAEGTDVVIRDSAAVMPAGIIYAYDQVGGLVAAAENVQIHSSYSRGAQILSLRGPAGGLIGSAKSVLVNTSSTISELVQTEGFRAGGLIGEGEDVRLYDVRARSGEVCAHSFAGGLIGQDVRGEMNSVTAETDQLCTSADTAVLLVKPGGFIGGLLGDAKDTRVSFAFAVTNNSISAATIGGLIGFAANVSVRSSAAVTRFINASRAAGGLIAQAENSRILSSYARTSVLRGEDFAGGLLARNEHGSIVSSYATGGQLSGNRTGGLLATASYTTVNSSYAAGGPLVGREKGGLMVTVSNVSVAASYWDETSLQFNKSGGGEPKTTQELQNTTDYSGIYVSWNHEEANDELLRWCDTDGNGRIDPSEQADDNTLWHFGTRQDYPLLSCVAGGLEFQDIQSPIIPFFPIESLPPSIPVPPVLLPDRREDPLRPSQWNVDRIGVPHLWQRNITGEGAHIAIVDDALEILHPDLYPNILPSLSRNFLERDESSPFYDDPLPYDEFEDAHGTAVAGIIAARGDNGIGIKGIAPRAGIYLSNYLNHPTFRNLAESFHPRTPQTVVISNSWGATFFSRLVPSSAVFREGMEGVLRHNGVGANVVFSAGNSRAQNDMASYEEQLNHHGVITVCAVSMSNISSSYSNRGPNLWICAPSSPGRDISTGSDKCRISYFLVNPTYDRAECGIPTTDLSGIAGYNQGIDWPLPGGLILEELKEDIRLEHFNFGGGDFWLRNGTGSIYHPPIRGSADYTAYFGGTSAAVPAVSGVIALLRAAYPQLTWRDVKLILAESAEQVDSPSEYWQLGAPAYHDAAATYSHHPAYGFGLIDAVAAERLASRWQNLPPQKESAATIKKMEGNGEESISGFLEVSQNSSVSFIEWVQVWIKSDENDFGKLRITLKSPQGTESILTEEHSCSRRREELLCSDLEEGFSFGAAAHIGERSEGEWQLTVEGLSRGSFLEWRLRFYGHGRP